ncbi:MAG: FAD-dependent oxidoreductase [Thermodesulfobacteriota bacterium]
MLSAAIAMGVLGILSAFALGVAARVFYVEVDPLVLRIEEALPGANCGGCGQPGCAGAAAAIAKGRMAANGCVAGGAAVGKVIATILGVEVKEREPQKAQVGCRYAVARADLKYRYSGVTDCRAAFTLYGGPKECPVGCIGLGACVKACLFGALTMGPDGLPVVNLDKCTGCGACVRTCPAHIMQLTSVTDRILNEYTWDQCTAPCQRRCPAGINIPEQIHQTVLRNYDRALQIIKERNPLPLICGRICPQPCELKCRRNLVDEPVAINNLKRFVADYERERGERYLPYKAPATGRRIAVIGGGVEGLCAGYFLARLGHSPTVFEVSEKLGGLLRTALPENRLPRDVLDWEIAGLLEMGVAAETGRALGRDFNLNDLFRDGFEAVLLAVGGWDALLKPGQTSDPGAGLPGVYLLFPLALAWAAGRKIEPGRRVVIAGSPKETLGVAQRCLAQGAGEVTIVCPSPLSHLGLSASELDQARAEGIRIMPRTRITGLYGEGDRLTGLTYSWMGAPDREMPADTVIAATGRLPDLIVTRVRPESAQVQGVEGGGETPVPSPQPRAEIRWRVARPYSPERRPLDLFAGREPVSDHWAAVEAVGAARRAAVSVHKLLEGQDLPTPLEDLSHSPARLDVSALADLAEAGPRAPMPEASPQDRLDPRREVALGLSEGEALAEASRCLNCGLICYQRTKYPLSPAPRSGRLTVVRR